jgi:hypothetical protein
MRLLLMMPNNPFQWGTQAHRLYERLTYGPIYNGEISRPPISILGYSKVIAQIRKALEGTGVTVKARPIDRRRTLIEYRLGTENTSNEGGTHVPTDRHI